MEIENVLKVIACKHASSTSSINQPADMGRQFANIHLDTKTMTVVNLPRGFGLKGFLEEMFDMKKASGELTLKLHARKAIIDHCVCCLEIFGKAMSPKKTKRGFIENGMIDVKSHLYPDVTMMLKTCKCEVKQEHANLL